MTRLAELEGEELARLWGTYAIERSVESRNRLVEAYQPLAHQLARRALTYARSVGSGITDAGDLLGLALEGLIKAVESFDPARGVSFASYARLRVSGHIKDGLRNDDFLTRRERQVVQAWLRGDPLDARRARRAARLASQRPSNTADLPGDLPGEEAGVEETALSRAQVAEALRLLGPTERAVLTHRYLDGMSLSAIGALLAITESRACQIHRAALRRLREALEPPEGRAS